MTSDSILISESIQAFITSFISQMLFDRLKLLWWQVIICHLSAVIINFAVIVEMFFFMIMAALWYRRVEGNVDHDLIERQTYKRLSWAHYKKNPAEQIILSDQDATNGDITMTPSPVVNLVVSDGIWRHRDANGNAAMTSKGTTGGSRKADSPCSHPKAGKHPSDNQKEPLLNNGLTDDRAVTNITLEPTFPIDKFASSRETDVVNRSHL